MTTTTPAPHIVAWESTVACNLACVHCRASAQTAPAADELTTGEAFGLIDQLAELGRPILVISGGEPLMRPDIFDIAAYGTERGLRMAVSPNGTLLTAAAVANLIKAGVRRISVSIDGSTAARHDAIRGVPGAFDEAMAGLARCREAGSAGLEVQVGSHPGETSLTSAAQLGLLAACGDVRYAEGCYGNLLLAEDPVRPVLQFGYGGRPPVRPPAPGFGVEIDEGLLRRTALRRDFVGEKTLRG